MFVSTVHSGVEAGMGERSGLGGVQYHFGFWI